MPTNDWWSSLVFKKGDECSFSQPLFAHPVAYEPVASGLGLSYQTDAGDQRQRAPAWASTTTRTPSTWSSAWPG